MLEFDLTEEQRALQRLARDFARNEIRPIAMAMDQGEVADNFPWDLIKKGSQLGLRTLTLPTEWGGVGADALSQLIVIDELAYEDVSCSKISNASPRTGRSPPCSSSLAPRTRSSATCPATATKTTSSSPSPSPSPTSEPT